MIDPSSWRVMVVEDEADSADLISQILQHYHVKVKVVPNGLKCLAEVESFWPTLIIMDLAMPELDGWQTLKYLRLNLNVAHIPIVAVTAFDSGQVAGDAELAGFDAYFAKPVDATVFLTQLSEIIGVRRKGTDS